MNNPNKIEYQVLSVFKENKEARNDDMKLYILVCNRYYECMTGEEIGSMTFEVIMNCYKELHLPHFERVRRTRAKLQSMYPEVDCNPAVSTVRVCIRLM